MCGMFVGCRGHFAYEKYRCYYVLPPLYSTGHMAMNAGLLKPGSDVFYLRGTEFQPVTVVGLSSFPECIAIRHPQMTCLRKCVVWRTVRLRQPLWTSHQRKGRDTSTNG